MIEKNSEEDQTNIPSTSGRWNRVKGQLLNDPTDSFTITKQKFTVRFVKIITETVIKKTKKQGVESVKKTKNNLIINFESANVLLS
jgi:hypothetical protein